MSTNDRLTVRVAVYVLLMREGKVLFARRHNTGWSDGKLSLPSGHVDPGETPTVAAVRELEEETGIKTSLEDLIPVHVDFNRDRYVDFYFTVNSWEGEPQITEPDKCNELVWVDIETSQDVFVNRVFQSVKMILAGERFYSESEIE